MTKKNRKKEFDIREGVLCLDLVNTVDNRPTVRRKDQLSTYQDLLEWGFQCKVLSRSEIRILKESAETHPLRARRVLLRTRGFREALFHIFVSIAAGDSPPSKEWAYVNDVVPEALASSQVLRFGGRFIWDVRGRSVEMDVILRLVAQSALQLLVSKDLNTLRICSAEDCAHVFMDRSKNRKRRWCDMKTCGNRSKVRKYRSRKSRRKQ